MDPVSEVKLTYGSFRVVGEEKENQGDLDVLNLIFMELHVEWQPENVEVLREKPYLSV